MKSGATGPKQPPSGRTPPEPRIVAEDTADRGDGLIFCGLCGALNPARNHFCAACGTTLLDAFHATEGTRVFERPDPAARLLEILPSGSELDIVEDADAPADYVRVRLPAGRLGYIRLADVGIGTAPETAAGDRRVPNINTNARGCVSTGGALAALALLVVTSVLAVVAISRSDAADAGVVTLVFCAVIGPMLLLTVGLYVAARGREDRLTDEEDEAAAAAADPEAEEATFERTDFA